MTCEHSDHETFIMPVNVEFVGACDDDEHEFYYMPHQEALIYTDGCIALTLWECCYSLWFVDTGEFHKGFAGEGWRLTEDSLAAIREHLRNALEGRMP